MEIEKEKPEAPAEEPDPKVVKDLQKKIEKMDKLASQYYEFFRLGGFLNWVAVKSMSPIEKASCALARKRIREEETKFTMKCMLAVFDHSLGEIMKHAPGQTPPVNGAKVKEPSPEEVAVSSVLDTMVGEKA